MAAEGVAFAVLAGLDGSPVWRVVRVLVVIAVTALAVWFTRRAGRTGGGQQRWCSGSRARQRARVRPART